MVLVSEVSDSGKFAAKHGEDLNEFVVILIDRFWRSGEIFHGGLASKTAVTKKSHKLAQLQLDNDP
jgi:hypothetical protein